MTGTTSLGAVMASVNIELSSPKKLFGRGVIGLLISAWALLFWTPPVGSEWLKPAIVIGGIVLFISAWKAFSDPKTAWNYFVNAGSCVHDVIQQWTPKQYRLELEYEKDLHAFLKQRLPFAKITRQYGSGRIKCDLAVATDVMIELKVKLTSTNKLQRLLGQIELFQKEWEEKPLIVAL